MASLLIQEYFNRDMMFFESFGKNQNYSHMGPYYHLFGVKREKLAEFDP